MAIDLRQGAIFGAGIALGAAAATWAVLDSHSAPAPAPPSASAPAPVQAHAQEQASAAAPKPSVIAAAPARPHAPCPAQPATVANGSEDGRVHLPADLGGKTAGDIAPLILAGKEAAAAGQPHDAEVSFLLACRLADRFKGTDSADAADARYQLARHYANVAQGGGPAAGAKANELRQRAGLLYADSLRDYQARYGATHEKTRFAAEGLATLQQAMAQSGQPLAAPVAVAAKPPAPAKPVAVAAKPAEPAKPVAIAARPPPSAKPVPAERPGADTPVRQARGTPVQGRPSFDCARARSPSERAICADGELARLDRDLGRLHAKAQDAAADRAAFRRHNDSEWRRREATCRGDRDCLLDWYAQRREQLLDDLDDAGDPRRPPPDR